MKSLFPLPLLLAVGVTTAQPNVIDLAPITVTASPEVDTVGQYLRPVTVVTREEIERRQPSSTAELLRLIPGIAIKRTGGRVGITSVFLRGTKSNHVLVLVNGVRSNSATTGGFAWRNINPQQIQRIEIERGPHTTRYGSGAMGGVIRIYTRDPTGFHAGFEVGSSNTFNTAVGYGGTHGALDYALDVAVETSDGIDATRPALFAHEPDGDGYDSQSLSINTNYRLSEATRIGLNVWASHMALDYDAGPLPPNATMEIEDTVVSLDFAQQINTVWSHDLQIGYMTESMVADASYYSAIDSRRISVNWRHTLQLTDAQQLSAGVSWERVEANNSRNYEQTNRNLAAFVSWQGEFGAHAVNVGLRHDDYEQFGGETTGSIAWTYDINPQWRLNASYATAFKAPTFNDLYWPGFSNPDLLPEQATSVEAGLSWRPNASHHVNIQLFHMDISNLIVGNWLTQNVTNKDTAETDGLELSYNGRHPPWYWRANLTLLRARDGHDRRLDYRPEKKLTLLIGRQVGAGRIQASVVLVSDRPENDEILGSYGLINITASYPLADAVTFYGRIENLTAEDYTLSQGYNTPGRQFFIGLRFAP